MTNAPCEQCMTTEGAPHAFHYGRTEPADHAGGTAYYHASAYPGSPLTPWTDRYQIGGVETVVLCERCLARARARRATRIVLREWLREPLVALGYAAWLVALVAWTWQGAWSSLAAGAAVGLGITVLVWAITYVILRDEDFAQHLAVDLHQERLRREGWDAFWTDRELPLLTPH